MWGDRGLPPRLWRRVEEALEEIVEVYERVNHLISLYQDERARRRGLRLLGTRRGITLELGSGPGNYTQLLAQQLDAPLLCLDFSSKMLLEAKRRLKEIEVHLLRGIFEALPLRRSNLGLVAAAYALRDSMDMEKAILEVRRTLKRGGAFLLIDLGRPKNPLIEKALFLHLRLFVPLIAGLAMRRGINNPWRLLYETYTRLPRNDELLRMLMEIIGEAEMEEIALGALIVALAEKTA